MRGRYSDGHSAATKDAEARIEGDVLVVRAGGERIAWPLAGLRRIDAADRTRLLVEPADGDGAQLALPMAEAGPLLAAAPALARTQAGRTLKLAAALIAVAAFLVFFVFVGLPKLSGPIARMIPPAAETGWAARAQSFMGYMTADCAASEEAQAILDDLGRRFAAVSASPFELDIQLADAAFPNAFALPGGHIVVTDDLLDIIETPEELAGVLAHETAHVVRRHAMAAVLRELGYSVVLDLVLGGGSGAGQEIALAGASLDSLRHSRGAEAEADALALEYLEALGIDGTGLAQFFERLNAYLAESGEDVDVPQLLSTHPDTLARAETARANAGPARGAAMTAEEWALLKAACGSADEEEA